MRNASIQIYWRKNTEIRAFKEWMGKARRITSNTKQIGSINVTRLHDAGKVEHTMLQHMQPTLKELQMYEKNVTRWFWSVSHALSHMYESHQFSQISPNLPNEWVGRWGRKREIESEIKTHATTTSNNSIDSWTNAYIDETTFSIKPHWLFRSNDMSTTMIATTTIKVAQENCRIVLKTTWD